MKKLLMIGAALAATTAATPAFATDFTVSGSVTASCGAMTDDPIAFGTIATDADGSLSTGQSKTNAGQPVYCNGVGSTISVSHDALKIGDGTGAPTGFTKTIDFTTSVDFAGVVVGDGASQTLGAQTGTLKVSANNLTASAKPLAGTYAGAVHVTVTPAL